MQQEGGGAMKRSMCVAIIFLVALFARSSFSAESYNNGNALTGIKNAKVYFDVNVGEPEKLLTRLQLIESTYNQLAASGLSPRIVVGIRGKASNFFTRDDGYVLNDDVPVKKKIGSSIEQFKALGFQLEQCAIAAGMQNIPTGDFLPQLEIVTNGYVSMIGYQSQGYAFVPMD